MSNLSFYLEKWAMPMLIVGLIYLIFLIPAYFLVKKYKPNYWLMISLSFLVIFVIEIILFFSMIKSGFKGFSVDLLYFSFFTNLIFFIFIPIFIKNFLTDKIKFNLFISYLLFFLFQIIFGYFLLFLIAWGSSSIIN